MAIENALIAKIIGGVSVIGGAGSAGVVYRNEIINKFQDIFGKNQQKDYFFVVAGTTATSDSGTDVEGSKKLYGDAEPKTKNYQCQIGSKKFECDIIKEISKNGDKKWINTKSYFSEIVPDKTVTKEKIKAADTLFLLKILGTNKPELTWNGTQKIDIIEKEILTKDKKPAAPKKFGQLKPIFWKENNEVQGKVNLFLAKVNGENGTIGTGNKKCYFDDDISSKKSCEIYKFTETQPTPLDNTTNYLSSNFVGTNLTDGQKITASTTINKHQYYLVKFSDDLKNSDFSGKKLVYVEENSGTTTTTINFSNPLVSFMFPNATGTDNNLLIIND